MRQFAILILAGATLCAQQYPFIPVPGSENLDFPQELLQDRDGRLWIGSRGGLSTYDGVRLLAVPGFPKLGVNRIEEGPDGTIWIATNTGLFLSKNGVLGQASNQAVGALVPLDGSTAIVTLGPPGHEVGYPSRLLRLWRAADGWKTSEIEGAPQATQYVGRSGDSLLYGCQPAGGCEMSIASIGKPAAERKLLRTDGAIMMRDQQNCLWFRRNGVATYQCPGAKTYTELPANIASQSDTVSLHATRSGDILIPSLYSIAIGRPGKFQVMTAQNGLPNNVQDAIEAQDGSLWIAASRGVFRCPFPFRLEYWNERDGMTDVLATTRNRGRVYAGGAAGLLLLDEDRTRWRRISTAPELQSIWTLSPEKDGTLLAGMFYHPLAQISATGAMLRRPPVARSTGARILRGTNGRILSFGSKIEEAMLGPGRMDLQVLRDPAIASRNWLDAEQTPDGKIWACSEGGLALWDQEGWRQRATEKDGLLQNGCRSLAVSPQGNVWYGYNTAEAFTQITSTGMKHFDGKNVSAPAIHFLDFDRVRGWLWRGAADGVYLATEPNAEKAVWFHLGVNSGFPKSGANQQAFFEDTDGSLWMGFDTTLAHFQPPKELLDDSVPPQVFLSGLSGTIAQLGSLDFHQRDQLQIRYRLLPSQKWLETKQLDLELGPLSGGTHQLEFQARSGAGAWGPSHHHAIPVSRSWSLLPWSLGTAGVSVLAWGAFRRRKRPELPELNAWREQLLSGEDQIPNRYKVVCMVSRGGFGTVYEVLDNDDNNARRALKLFHQDIPDQEWLARRFEQEVQALETLNHSNIVRIWTHGWTSTGLPYLVMDFIDGPSLRDIVKQGPFPPRRLARVLRQLGSALAAIHSAGIFHRDVKPENVILRAAGSPEESAVLIDFSIALIQDPGETIHRLSRAAGSLAYMPPEQAIGFSSPASDIYSLAIVTIELLLGQRLNDLLPNAALDYPNEVRQLLERRFQLPDRAIYLLTSALDFHPRNRPVQILEFVDVIASALET